MNTAPKFQDFNKVTNDAFSKDFTKPESVTLKINHTSDHGNDFKLFGENAKFTYNICQDKALGKNGSFKFESENLKIPYSSYTLSKFEETFDISKSVASQTYEATKGKYSMKVKFGSELNDKAGTYLKPEMEFNHSVEKAKSCLKFAMKDNFMGMDNANFNIAYNAAGANIGADLTYNFANSKIAHHLKLAKSSNGLNFCLGLKQANVIELSASKNINKSLKTPCGCIAFDLDNFHSKSTYDLNKSNWESSVAFDYNNINAFGFALSKGKSKINLKTLEYADRASFKINDSLSVNLGSKTNLDADAFKNWRIGAALNFSL